MRGSYQKLILELVHTLKFCIGLLALSKELSIANGTSSLSRDGQQYPNLFRAEWTILAAHASAQKAEKFRLIVHWNNQHRVNASLSQKDRTSLVTSLCQFLQLRRIQVEEANIDHLLQNGILKGQLDHRNQLIWLIFARWRQIGHPTTIIDHPHTGRSVESLGSQHISRWPRLEECTHLGFYHLCNRFYQVIEQLGYIQNRTDRLQGAIDFREIGLALVSFLQDLAITFIELRI